MNDKIRENEQQLRRAVRRLGFDIDEIHLERDYDGEFVVDMVVNIEPDESEHKIDEELK